MTDKWRFKSNTFASCNCDSNCGCQFNLPSTHGLCEFVEGGFIEEGYFNDVKLSGLKWAMMMKWPGEIPEGNGRAQFVIDQAASDEQREAIEKIITGEAGEPGSNHFSVFASTRTELLGTLFSSIEYEIDMANRTALLEVPGVIRASGKPIMNDFTNEPFHIALSRPAGSFEFTYAEIGSGTASVSGQLPIELDGTYAQFCVHNYDQNGLVAAA